MLIQFMADWGHELTFWYQSDKTSTGDIRIKGMCNDGIVQKKYNIVALMQECIVVFYVLEVTGKVRCSFMVYWTPNTLFITEMSVYR